MNFGYLIFVAAHPDIDYLKLAYALALSIKNTQKPGYDKVALVIDKLELVDNLKSPWVFDHVIAWDKETHWDGRSWMDQLSPFENTVCLDADMLFYSSVEPLFAEKHLQKIIFPIYILCLHFLNRNLNLQQNFLT